MLNIRTIIVPIDLDKHTSKLVEYAASFAKQFGAEIDLVHVVDFIVANEMALGNATYDDVNNQRKVQAAAALKELTQKTATAGTKITDTVLAGDVVDELLDYIEEKEFDLVIMGSHGHRGLGRILLGSVAERIMKNAYCPVLIMNPYREI